MDAGEAAGRRSQLSPGQSVQVSCWDALEVSGPVRSRWNAGTGGRPWAGLSDSQRAPHVGSALWVLQAARRQAPAPHVPATDSVVIGLPGSG